MKKCFLFIFLLFFLHHNVKSTVIPLDPTVTITGGTYVINGTNVEMCVGNQIQLTANVSPAPTNYNWYKNGGILIGTGSTITITIDNSFIFINATAEDGSGESNFSNSIDISIVTAPTSVSIDYGSAPSYCNGTPSTLNAVATGATSYKWYLDRITNPAPIATTSSISVSTSGVYTLEAINQCGSTFSTDVSISQATSAPSGLSITSNNGTLICNSNTLTLTCNVTVGNTGVGYQWYLNSLGNPISAATNSTYITSSIGTYFCKATNACGFSSSSLTLTSGTSPATAVINVPSNNAACNGSSVILVANSAGASKYEWYKDGAFDQLTSFNFAVITQTGNYKVRGVNACGNGSFSNSQQADIIKPPTTANIAYNDSPTIGCARSTLTLTASSDGGPSSRITYQWYKNGSTLVGTGTTYGANSAGQYTVKAVADNSCGTATSSSVDVYVVNQLPVTPTISSTSGSSCSGSIQITATTGTSGTFYEFYKDDILVQTSLANTYTASQTGVYKARANNACGLSGYSNTLGLSIFVSSVPKPTISLPSGSNTTCQGGTILLQANTSLSSPIFRWYRNNQLISGATSSVYTASQSGSYIIEVSNGVCSQFSEAQEIIISDLSDVLISYSGNLSFCEGDSVLIQAISSDNTLKYSWLINGTIVSTTKSYYVKKVGKYNLDLKAVNTCGGSKDFSLPIVVTTNSSPELYLENNFLTVKDTADFYQWRLNGVPIAGANQKKFQANISGYYTVVLANKSGCIRVSKELNIRSLSDSDSKLIVYPNPSDGNFNVVLKSGKSAVAYLIDMQGRTMMEQSLSPVSTQLSQTIFNVTSIGKGIYLLRVVDADGTISQRVIIE